METLTLILKETVQQLRILFNSLPYVELLTCLCNPHLCPLHPDQLLLTKSAQDFINQEQAAHLERVETGEYIAPGGGVHLPKAGTSN